MSASCLFFYNIYLYLNKYIYLICRCSKGYYVPGLEEVHDGVYRFEVEAYLQTHLTGKCFGSKSRNRLDRFFSGAFFSFCSSFCHVSM